MEWLKERFPDKLISIKSDFVWLPRSLDLNPCDFFLWVFMKEEVSKRNPSNRNELKEEVIDVIRSIPVKVLRRVSIERQVRKCIEAVDGLMED